MVREHSLESFFENFDALVNALGGVEQLRQLVVSWAAGGRLSGARNKDDLNDAGWQANTLSALGRWGSGGTPARAESSNYGGTIPWLKIADLNDGLIKAADEHITATGLEHSSAKLIPAGTVLIAMYGSIGKLGLTAIPCATNQAIAHCVPDQAQVFASYLMLLLRASRRSLVQRGRGMAQQNISQTTLKAFEVLVPPLAEQKRIVAKVDQLMALCDELEARQTKKREIGTRLTKSALDALTTAENSGEFDAAWNRALANFDILIDREDKVADLRGALLGLAMSGKLTERVAGDGLGIHLLECRHDLPVAYLRGRKIFKDISTSDTSRTPATVPPHWAVATVQDLYDRHIITDFADGNHGSHYPRSGEFGDDGVPFVTAKNIVDGRVDVAGSPRLRREKAEKLTKGWAQGGDVLLTHNATVGRVGIVSGDQDRFLLGTSATYYRLNPTGLDPRFFAHYLMSPFWQSQLTAVMEQTTRNQVSIQKQAKFLVRLPPLNEQRRVASRLDSLLKVCDDLEARLRTAEHLAARSVKAVLQELFA